MKVRIKFSKEGPVKFVGHLDTMRYFQKALRRAELPVAFSGGYSPHMIMSFAVPLGVALVAAADYLVEFRPGKEPSIDWKSRVKEFLAQPEIKVTKQTKRSEKEIDLRPNIYKMEVRENGFFYMLASASSNYTKPEMVTNTFFHWIGEELPEFAFTVKRLEMYADQGENASPRFVTLESLGEEIE